MGRPSRANLLGNEASPSTNAPAPERSGPAPPSNRLSLRSHRGRWNPPSLPRSPFNRVLGSRGERRWIRGDLLLLLLPVHAERRIGEEVVEGLARELVLGEAVAEADVVATAVVVDLLHQHVGCRGGEGALVVILPVDVETRGAVVIAQLVLGLRQHAAGSAGWVKELPHGAGRGEQLVVLDE